MTVTPQYRVFRASTSDRDAARGIVEAYYEAVGVQVRDTPESFEKYFADDAGIWLVESSVSSKRSIVGCVFLRSLPAIDGACEVKRMYVEPGHRGARLASRLMEALHDYAKDFGYRWVYLDTKDDLDAAIALYTRLGYERCERYNDNPQATVFMRKAVVAEAPVDA